MSLPGHRRLVCQPPQPRPGALARIHHASGGGAWWRWARLWGALSRWSEAPRGSAPSPNVHGRPSLGAAVLASWSTFPVREASGGHDGVMATAHRSWPATHQGRHSQQGGAWWEPRSAGPGDPAHWSWRPRTPCYRKCTMSGPSGPPLPPGRRAPPLLPWCRPTHTSPACHAIGNTPAPAIHPGQPLPGLVPDRPLPAPPGTRAVAAPRPD